MHVLPHLSAPHTPTCTRWRQHQVRSDRVSVTLARWWNSSSVGCRERRGGIRLDWHELAAALTQLLRTWPSLSSGSWRNAVRRTALQVSVPGETPFPYGNRLIDTGTHLVTSVSLFAWAAGDHEDKPVLTADCLTHIFHRNSTLASSRFLIFISLLFRYPRFKTLQVLFRTGGIKGKENQRA